MLEFTPYNLNDRLFFIIIALVLNAILGALPWLKQNTGLRGMALFLRRFLLHLEQKLNRHTRTEEDRIIRGAVVLVVILLITCSIACLFSHTTALHPWTWVLEASILALFIPQRQIYERGSYILQCLLEKDIHRARKSARVYSLRDTHNLDDHAIARTTIEYIASALSDRVLSAIFWYVILGLPGFVASKIITEAGWIMGYASSRYRSYGRAASAGETVINWVPARLASIMIAIASLFIPNGRPVAALYGMFREVHSIHLPQKGSAVAAAARAMRVSLGGPRSVQGYLIQDKWVGTGSAKVSLLDLRKFLLLYAIACLLNIVLIASLLIVRA